jgi:RNA polymerase sigma-70 factor (ECF subfamily)
LRQALSKLEKAYEAAGNGAIFLTLRDLLTDGSPDRSYQQVGSELGLTEAAARFAAFKLRQRYRAVLREIIADTVAAQDEIEDELAHLRTLFRI